jgi:hypothetical protein
MSNVHEFMMLSFNDGVDDSEQLRTMRALDTHLGGCTGLVSREYFRGAEGHWVEHVIWESATDVEASTHLDDDPEVAALFDRFDPETVAYLCGKRIEPGLLAVSATDEAART